MTQAGTERTDKVDAALIREYAELFKPTPWAPPSPAMRRLCELQTVRAGIVGGRTEWRNRIGSGLGDDTATTLAAATIEHFTRQLEAVDRAIAETIDQDAELRGRRDLLLSVIGVGETLTALLLAEMPEPAVLRRSSEVVAYAGLNPSHHRSGTSIDRPTRISKIGNAGLRSALYMPALAAMRFNPAIAALRARLKSAGRLKPKQIVVAAMRKLAGHLLDNVASFAHGIVHEIPRERLRRPCSPAPGSLLRPLRRSGPTRPVEDGGHHAQATPGAPAAPPGGRLRGRPKRPGRVGARLRTPAAVIDPDNPRRASDTAEGSSP